MSPSPPSRLIAISVILLILSLAPRVSLAQQEQAVLSGIQYLRGVAPGEGQVGETAMIALALIKADVPKSDPVLMQCLEKIRKRFTGSAYEPQRHGGQDIYEAAVVAMVLANMESEDHKGEINLVATFLIGRQNPNGSWDYTNRQHGDASISQYALLGLWECENAGYDVPPHVWDRAASWYLSVQAAAGSWNYHRDQPEFSDNMSMTAAGVGSLLLCKRQLNRYKQSRRGESPLMTVLSADPGSQAYQITTSMADLDQSVKKGIAWLTTNFTTTNTTLIGQSIYYGLYGLERVSALAERQTLGRSDIMEKGRSFIRTSQKPNGSWQAAPQPDELNTVWAVLYLTKSTAKSIRRVIDRKLGAGTLVGGRYLPKDLTSMTVAGGRIMSRPMNGAVEGMLAVLEDPRAQGGDAAVAGLIERYHREGSEVLRPHKDRFRKMLKDRDPGLRQVAAWALSRTGDLDVAPDLIEAVRDPDESVVVAARLGLQILSRKIDGLGPPSPSTPEEREQAARAWKAWYDAIRPLGGATDDDEIRKPASRESASQPPRSPNP
ncbi:HEAT repeat domain-containing protein [Aquisphaera insulae]|uniref:HEAT repeat domain-containing protein n=1 Tax=Aquisphaera insulae TaxID=2712864 RepID=UPI0013EBB6AB|nr:HEAT repeat domain-containing protein [Aquisphaera insulae]